MKAEDITKTLELSCPSCGGSTFELRVLTDEGVACACCTGCRRNYLLLDSEDYWFDLIQAGYPRLRRCACQATSFNLRCGYRLRDDGDVRSVDVWSLCPSCAKAKCQTHIDIDYSPTDDLLSRPLRYCKTPDIRYDLKDVSLYLTPPDMASLVAYLGGQHQCVFTGWLPGDDGNWIQCALDTGAAQQAIISGRYLNIYASLKPLHIADREVATAKAESAYWKRTELIRIASPTHIRIADQDGLLYCIQFANDCVKDDQVVKKAPAFIDTTSALLAWLGVNFVSWRGKLCFDNPAENLRIFGDRFAKGRAKAATTK